MGRKREQPPRKVLLPHARRPQTTRRRNRKVEPHGRNHRQHPRPNRGPIMITRFKSWLRSTLDRRHLEENMDDEIQFHIDARAADLIHSGLAPEEAKRRARLEFGTIASHKDGMRTSLGLRWLDDLWCDLRYAARILRKSPGFTAIAVGSLALAIGANTTIFSIANEMLYERLGVPHPEQLRLFTLTGDKNVAVHSSWGNWDRL